jgi:tetratricopeptide (TPR) repeat protein
LAYAQLSYLKSIVYWFGIDSSPPVIAAARAAAARAVALQPDLPEAHLAMGYVHYWGHRDYAAALAEFATARASLPNDSSVLKAMARVHRRQGNPLQAIPEFEQAATLDPRDTDLAREIGVTLTCLRRYAEADAAFARSLALSPDNAYAYVYRAGASQLSGDFGAASKVLAAVPPGLDPQGAVSLQRFLLAMGMRQPDTALAVLAKAPAWLNDGTDGLMMPASLWRGQALALKGETGPARSAFLEAEQALEEKLSTSREPAGIESYLAIAYAGLGEKDAALKGARRATELLPMSQDVLGGAWYLYQLAEVEAQFGETESAIKHIEQLLAAPAGFYISEASLRTDPAWDPIRNDPRFERLSEKQ